MIKKKNSNSVEKIGPKKNFWVRLNFELDPFLKTIQNSQNQEQKNLLQKRIVASLMGTEDPTEHEPIFETSPLLNYLRDLLHEYCEIDSSLERMRMSLLFISRTSFRQKQVTPVAYFRYHYEFYLNEIYIFGERIERFLTLLERKCKKANLNQDANTITEVKKEIRKALENIYKIRGSHVHLRRHKNRKIEQLEALEGLSENFDFIAEYRDIEGRAYKKTTSEEMKKNIDNLDSVINVLIPKRLGGIIFGTLLLFHKKRS